jgi:hypothetical protein
MEYEAVAVVPAVDVLLFCCCHVVELLVPEVVE